MFCRHDYEIIAKLESKSEAEQLHDMGLRPNTHTSFVKKHCLVTKCKKCKKIKKHIFRM